MCESRGGRPGLPVPNGSYGLCGRKATLNCSITEHHGLPVPNSSYGLCGRKATYEEEEPQSSGAV